MKRVVEVKAKDSDNLLKVSIRASVVTAPFRYTKEESQRKVENLTNKIHSVVREMGFDVREIRVV